MMKKKLIILGVVLVLIIAFLVGASLTKKKNLEEEYLSIFNNRKFILNGKKKNINDILGNENTRVDKYSFVDFGNDSHIEMFISISGEKNENYVFDYQGNKMYAYLLDESINANTEDGYSSVAGDYSGWVKYTFNKKKMKKEKIVYIDYNNNKCEYKNEEIDCSKIVDKEIEFLKTIGKVVETVEYAKDELEDYTE